MIVFRSKLAAQGPRTGIFSVELVKKGTGYPFKSFKILHTCPLARLGEFESVFLRKTISFGPKLSF
jgi:hypothetical protein